MAVRPAELAEIDRVVPLYEWLFEPPGSRPPGWDREQVAAALAGAVTADDAVVLIAEVDGRFVGLCTVYEDFDSVRFGRGVVVEDLAVDPDQRSRGIGKELLDEARRWALSRGATRLQLDSSEARTDAHRFYERERPDWRSVRFGWEL
jgi:GNAT superfamily N-acetyltransferase